MCEIAPLLQHHLSGRPAEVSLLLVLSREAAVDRYRAAVDSEGLRPWGHYEVLVDEPDYKTKAITVQPGGRLSYQRHAQRSEHWVIVRGSGVATLDGVRTPVLPGTALDVPVGTAHRIENDGAEALVFVEVQRGDYLGEDDIVRLDDDDYGRSDRGLPS